MSGKKIIIVGAGPAGCALSINLARYNIPSILIEKEEIGAFIKYASLIENYPGFPKGITGQSFSNLLKEHINRDYTTIIYDEIKKISLFNNKFLLHSDENKYVADIVVLATGTKPKKISLLNNLYGNNLFYNITFLRNVSNKIITVIGAGEIGMDYSLTLSKRNTIFILARSSYIRSNFSLYKKITSIENIKVIFDFDLADYKKGNDGKIVLFSSNGQYVITDYILGTIGRESNLPEVDFNFDKFNNEFFFMIGDVNSKRHERYVSKAISDASLVTYTIVNKLGKEKIWK